jgi:hypothetical protein
MRLRGRLCDATLGELPAALSEAGLAPDALGCWLWAAPRDPAAAQGVAQLLIELPPGRYRLDYFDAGADAWIASESAAAAPLVVSLPFRGAPLVVRVRRHAGRGQGPRPATPVRGRAGA